MGPIQAAVVCVLSLFALSVTHPATCQELPTSYSVVEVKAHDARCDSALNITTTESPPSTEATTQLPLESSTTEPPPKPATTKAAPGKTTAAPTPVVEPESPKEPVKPKLPTSATTKAPPPPTKAVEPESPKEPVKPKPPTSATTKAPPPPTPPPPTTTEKAPPKPRELVGRFVVGHVRPRTHILSFLDNTSVAMLNAYFLGSGWHWIFGQHSFLIYKYDDHFHFVNRKLRLAVPVAADANGAHLVTAFTDTEAAEVANRGKLDGRIFLKVSKKDAHSWRFKGGMGVYISTKIVDKKSGQEVAMHMVSGSPHRKRMEVVKMDATKSETKYEFHFLERYTGKYSHPDQDDIYWFIQRHMGYGLLANGAPMVVTAPFYLTDTSNSVFKRHNNGGLMVMGRTPLRSRTNNLQMNNDTTTALAKGDPTPISFVKSSHPVHWQLQMKGNTNRTFTVGQPAGEKRPTLTSGVPAGANATIWFIMRSPYRIGEILGFE